MGGLQKDRLSQRRSSGAGGRAVAVETHIALGAHKQVLHFAGGGLLQLPDGGAAFRGLEEEEDGDKLLQEDNGRELAVDDGEHEHGGERVQLGHRNALEIHEYNF